MSWASLEIDPRKPTQIRNIREIFPVSGKKETKASLDFPILNHAGRSRPTPVLGEHTSIVPSSQDLAPMASSPARMTANRANSLKSTGPKTLEGKAASRLNALQHGMAGAGDLIAPGEDLALVNKRAEALAREFHAQGDSGQILAHRAALLSIRMERLAERDFQAVAADVAAARVQFDRDWADDLSGWVEALEGDEPRVALDSLEQSPQGLAHLQDAWKQVRDVISGVDEQGHSFLAEKRMRLWLGLSDEEAFDFEDDDYLVRIDAELARLGKLGESLTHFDRVLKMARDEAGLLASFNPSPESTLARRYEAAAERGMYRAFRAITELNRAAESERVEPLPETFPPMPPPKFPAPPMELFSARESTPLASFRAAVLPPQPTPARSLETTPQRSSSTPEERKKRPDPVKAARKLALARR